MSEFVVGKAFTLDYELSLDDEPIDATVTVTVVRPDGTAVEIDIEHVSTGVYSASGLADQAGVWRYRWEASGAATDAAEGAFAVAETSLAEGALPGMIVTLDAARRHLQFEDEDHEDDDELLFFLSSASEWMAKKVVDVSPKPVQNATLELLRHLWDTQRGPVDGSLDSDTLVRPGSGFAIPNRVMQLIEPYLPFVSKSTDFAGSFSSARW